MYMLCHLAYIGKTVQTLRSRINQHRGFVEKLGTSTDIELSDENTLAAHALEVHGKRTKAGFNDLYKCPY